MGAEEFFNAIREKCSSEEEYAVEVIRARGFLMEDKDLILGDNSYDESKNNDHFQLRLLDFQVICLEG